MFKVGDRVRDTSRFGNGVVSVVLDAGPYCIDVEFECQHGWYTRDGRYLISQEVPSLFLIEPAAFENAEVGDRVCHISKGWGSVNKVKKENGLKQLHIIFDNKGNHWYSLEGKSREKDTRPVLYWNEVCFDIPLKPKKKVKKYQVLHRWKGRNKYFVTDGYYEDIESFVMAFSGHHAEIKLLDGSPIEVEE